MKEALLVFVGKRSRRRKRNATRIISCVEKLRQLERFPRVRQCSLTRLFLFSSFLFSLRIAFLFHATILVLYEEINTKSTTWILKRKSMVVEAFSVGNDLLPEKDDLFCTCMVDRFVYRKSLTRSFTSFVSFRSVYRGHGKEASIRYRNVSREETCKN